MLNKRVLLVMGAGLGLASPMMASAAIDLTPLYSAQSSFKAMSEDFASALSYKSVSPVEALGLTGFDIGYEGSLTELPNSTKWISALGLSGTTKLAFLPMGKLHAHKGLPFGIDIAGSYMYPEVKGISYWGGEIRYSFLSGNLAIPAIGIRGTYSQLTGVPVMDLKTKGIELGVSKGFLLLKPYAAIGMVWSDATPKGTAANFLKAESISQMKYNVGLNLNLGLMNFAFDWDQTGQANTYTGKVGFRW